MITYAKDEEAKYESQQQSRFSPSSPSSSRSIPFRDDPTENDALLGLGDSHTHWGSRASERASTSSSLAARGGRIVPGEPDYHQLPAHASVDSMPPPPRFAPYQAEYFEVGYEDICSHDPHLNSDGEALYRFILARAQRPPFMRVHVSGSHTEHKTRWITRTGNDGQTRHEPETYTETITDFDFCVDIKPVIYTTRTEDGTMGGQIPIDPIHWSVADHVPAYRGKMVKEIEQVSIPALGSIRRERRKAKRKESKARDAWVTESSARGLPPWCEEREVDFEGRNSSTLFSLNTGGAVPWVAISAEIEKTPLRSSRTLRQWADDYCASPKRLKEFVYTQELYGWNIQQIESAIRSTVLATPYNGDLAIQFTKHRSKIYIRPDNTLSRMLSNKWLKVLSIILLIYPFIWLFKRFHSRGGGRWEVCGGAYPLKRWIPLDAEEEPNNNPHNTSADAAPGDLPPYSASYRDDHTTGDSWHSPSSPSRRPLSVITNSRPSSQYHNNLFAERPGSIARTSSSSSSRVLQTPSGPKKLLGLREGEWFRRWERPIARAVATRYQSTEPLPEAEQVEASISLLDGY